MMEQFTVQETGMMYKRCKRNRGILNQNIIEFLSVITIIVSMDWWNQKINLPVCSHTGTMPYYYLGLPDKVKKMVLLSRNVEENVSPFLNEQPQTLHTFLSSAVEEGPTTVDECCGRLNTSQLAVGEFPSWNRRLRSTNFSLYS